MFMFPYFSRASSHIGVSMSISVLPFLLSGALLFYNKSHVKTAKGAGILVSGSHAASQWVRRNRKR
jgi:hypothetical protein